MPVKQKVSGKKLMWNIHPFDWRVRESLVLSFSLKFWFLLLTVINMQTTIFYPSSKLYLIRIEPYWKQIFEKYFWYSRNIAFGFESYLTLINVSFKQSFQIDAVDPGATAILYSAQYELEYFDADDDTKAKMTEEAPSQLDKIITNGFKGLGLEYFFTAGHDEVRVSKGYCDTVNGVHPFGPSYLPERLKVLFCNMWGDKTRGFDLLKNVKLSHKLNYLMTFMCSFLLYLHGRILFIEAL